MVEAYAVAKLLHVFVAIVALGTSAGLGVLLELYGDDPEHGAFMLRAIRRVEALVVLPGYLLMPVTGLWMVRLAWPLSTRWIQDALLLWGLGLVVLGAAVWGLHRQIALAEAKGPRYRRAALVARVAGAAAGLLVVAILYLMVAKPAEGLLPW